MRLCEGSLGWLGGVLDMRCALGWTEWSGNASRRCTKILAMVANTDNA
jgi:hypothetical protein